MNFPVVVFLKIGYPTVDLPLSGRSVLKVGMTSAGTAAASRSRERPRDSVGGW
jgi:hypothetical protein